VAQAQTIAQFRGWTPLVALLANNDAERY